MVKFNSEYSFLATMCHQNSSGAIGFTHFETGGELRTFEGERLTMATVAQRNTAYLFLFRDDTSSYEIKFLSDDGALHWNLICFYTSKDSNDRGVRAGTRIEGSYSNDNLDGWDLFYYDDSLKTDGARSKVASAFSVTPGSLGLGVTRPICIRAPTQTYLALEKKTYMGNEWFAPVRCLGTANARESDPLIMRLDVLKVNIPFEKAASD